MPIITITKTTKTRGSRGIITAIAKYLNVSKQTVSEVNRGRRTSRRVSAALAEFQRTGRLPGLSQ